MGMGFVREMELLGKINCRVCTHTRTNSHTLAQAHSALGQIFLHSSCRSLRGEICSAIPLMHKSLIL